MFDRVLNGGGGMFTERLCKCQEEASINDKILTKDEEVFSFGGSNDDTICGHPFNHKVLQ